MAKPYRERAELFAQNPQGRIYGGFYPGQGFGTFGGGVDPGEDPQEAAAREFQEESGYPVSNVRPAPVDPYVEDWKAFSKKPEYANDPKFQERFKKFKGSRTHYFLGDIAGKRESKGSNDSAYPFESVRFRAAPTVISKHEKDLQSVTDPVDVARLQQRLAVLRSLQGTTKEAEILPMSIFSAAGYQAVFEKLALPRWEQMARKFPEILEGKDLLKYRLRSYLKAKDKWNALYPRTPTRDARAIYDRDFFPKDIRDFNRGLNSDDLFNLRGRSQIAPLKYPYPELKNTPFQERALEAYKKLPLEEGGLTRAERIRELWKRDRPISSMGDKALYQPESDFVHATRPIMSTL